MGSSHDLPAVPLPPVQSKREEQTTTSTTTTTSKGKQRGGDRDRGRGARGGYVDVIDKLDVSGLDMAFHHSGPFDAARSRPNGPNSRISRAPINAFSSTALDPAKAMVSPSGADLAPLRQSGNGALSARAKAALNAPFNDPMNGESSENQLRQRSNGTVDSGSHSPGSPASLHGRRNSDSSIVLGFPTSNGGRALSAKDRQYMEAFGVHGEAWEDYGNGGYSLKASSQGNGMHKSVRKDPRVSVFPQDAKMGGILSKEDRAGRVASIWDIEATLRAGKPIASAPPPMPVLPSEFRSISAPSNALQFPNSASNDSASGSHSTSFSDGHDASTNSDIPKRSKSLLGRFSASRSRKTSDKKERERLAAAEDAEIQKRLQTAAANASGNGNLHARGFSNSAGASASFDLQRSTEHQQLQQSRYYTPQLNGQEWTAHSPRTPAGDQAARADSAGLGLGFGNSQGSNNHTPIADQFASQSVFAKRPHQQQPAVVSPVSATAHKMAALDVVSPSSAPQSRIQIYAQPSPRTSPESSRLNAHADAAGTNKKRPPPASPLGLPEPVGYFDDAKVGGLARSKKYDDLAQESATAAFLAESSSKESALSNNSTSSSATNNNNSAASSKVFLRNAGAANASSGDTPDTSFGSTVIINDRSMDSAENGAPLNTGNSPENDRTVKRKPSFARRFLGGRSGGKKKSEA